MRVGHGSVVVAVALVAVLGAMVMALIVLVAVIVMGVVVTMLVIVIMAAAAARAMGMGMGVGMGMGMRFGMSMRMPVLVPMAVVLMTMVFVAMMVVPMIVAAIGVIVVIGAALGLERPRHLAHGAALAADHLGEGMVVLDIDRLGGELGRRMAAADMPGDAHQAQRVLGPDLDQVLGRGADQHQAAILELHRIAIVQGRGLVEVEQDFEPAIALERDAAAIAVLMVEGQGLDDPVLLDRGLADDGGGALHVTKPVACWIRGDRPIAIPPLRSPERR